MMISAPWATVFCIGWGNQISSQIGKPTRQPAIATGPDVFSVVIESAETRLHGVEARIQSARARRIDFIADAQSHGHKTDTGTRTAEERLNLYSFSLFGRYQRHVIAAFLSAVGANPIDFHFVLEHVETKGGGNMHLQGLELIVFELDNSPAFGTDHMVMVLTEMKMLITNGAVVKTVFFSKSVKTEEL